MSTLPDSEHLQAGVTLRSGTLLALVPIRVTGVLLPLSPPFSSPLISTQYPLHPIPTGVTGRWCECVNGDIPVTQTLKKPPYPVPLPIIRSLSP